MNYPKELIIKRDITNTKVENKQEIIEFIDKYYELDILEGYLSSLKIQNKLDPNELIEIIEATEKKVNEIKNYLDNYELIKNDESKLVEFYENNYKFIEGLINYYIEKGV